jgi:hypothetical protein
LDDSPSPKRLDAKAEALPGVRVLLLTQNVTGVFDEMGAALTQWVGEMQELVAQHASDFIAVHLQEVGGAEWKGGGMDRAVPFVAAVREAFEGFWCSGLVCNPNVAEGFTALGCMYLVRCVCRSSDACMRCRVRPGGWMVCVGGRTAAGDFVKVGRADESRTITHHDCPTGTGAPLCAHAGAALERR